MESARRRIRMGEKKVPYRLERLWFCLSLIERCEMYFESSVINILSYERQRKTVS